MFYVHESVPESVSKLVVPRIDRYLQIFRDTVNSGGLGYCEIVSTGMLAGLKERVKSFEKPSDRHVKITSGRGKAKGHPKSSVINSGLVCGDYRTGPFVEEGYSRRRHFWVFIQEGSNSYSIDMTHKQTGSPYVIIVIPSSLEPQFELNREWIVDPSEYGRSWVSSRLGDEVYRLFRYE